MAYSSMQWASVNVANAGTLSSAIDLGRIYDFIQLDVPPINTSTITIDVSKTAGGTYNALATTANVDVTTGSKQIVMNIHGYQFLKLNCVNAQGANRTFWYRAYAI